MIDAPSFPPPDSSIPVTESANQPLPFRRDPTTGLVVGKVYRYTPEGKIDWRAEVPTQFLYVAYEYRDRVIAEQGKPLNEIDVLKVKDDWLRIRVGGLNYLAHLRGVHSCTYPHFVSRDGYAATVCQITFIGNRESGMQPETWSSMASATLRSVDKQFIPYLETFAENRAFGRCVKRALQINILSDVEVGGESKKAAGEGEGQDATTLTDTVETAPTGFQPFHYLITKCRDNKDAKGKPSPITFALLKASAVEMNANTPPERANERCVSDPAQWEGFESIPPADVWLLMGKIEAAATKEETGKKTSKSKV